MLLQGLEGMFEITFRITRYSDLAAIMLCELNMIFDFTSLNGQLDTLIVILLI